MNPVLFSSARMILLECHESPAILMPTQLKVCADQCQVRMYVNNLRSSGGGRGVRVGCNSSCTALGFGVVSWELRYDKL
jgi:hypothetical protein